MKSKPQIGGGMGERDVLFIFYFLFSLNLAVNPLHAEI